MRESSPGWGVSTQRSSARSFSSPSSIQGARALRAPASITAGVSPVASSSRTRASDASVPSSPGPMRSALARSPRVRTRAAAAPWSEGIGTVHTSGVWASIAAQAAAELKAMT